MHVLKRGPTRACPGSAEDPPAGPRILRLEASVAHPGDGSIGPEAQIPSELWPPVAIARRMEARERELQRMLDDMCTSIDHLRRDRKALIGQLYDLTRPTDCPVEPVDTSPPGPWAPDVAARQRPQGKGSAQWRRRESRQASRSEPPPEPLVAAVVSEAGTPAAAAAPGVEASAEAAIVAEHPAAAPEAPALPCDAATNGPPAEASRCEAAVLPPRTPEEEFEALVKRLRRPSAGIDAPGPQDSARPVAVQQSAGPARLAAVAVTTALMVLVAPTVGLLRNDSEPAPLSGRARFLDVVAAPDLRLVPPTPAPARTAAPDLRLELTTIRPAWIQAVIDDGWTIEQVLAGGVTIPVDARSAISLVLGDAGAVRLRVNGEDQGPAGDDGEAVARQFESSTVVTTHPSSPSGNTPE